MSSLQSAGEAQGSPAGYQTDTRHIRAEMWGGGCEKLISIVVAYRIYILRKFSFTCRWNWTTAYVTSMSYVGAVTSPILNKMRVLFLPVGVYGLQLSFQIHASIRRHDKYSTVWKAANKLTSNVFWPPLCHHGKIFVSASYGNRLLYSTGNVCVCLQWY